MGCTKDDGLTIFPIVMFLGMMVIFYESGIIRTFDSSEVSTLGPVIEELPTPLAHHVGEDPVSTNNSQLHNVDKASEVSPVVESVQPLHQEDDTKIENNEVSQVPEPKKLAIEDSKVKSTEESKLEPEKQTETKDIKVNNSGVCENSQSEKSVSDQTREKQSQNMDNLNPDNEILKPDESTSASKAIGSGVVPDIPNNKKAESSPSVPSKRSSLLVHLLEEYKGAEGDIEKQLKILTNLQQLSERYENARNLFSQTDALESVLLPGLKSPSTDIRIVICKIFAVAGQNNPFVQSKSVKGGVLIYFINLIKFDPVVRPKAIWALGSILRNYPDSQKQFIKDGGVMEVIKVAYLPETRRRILELFMDMINERKLCKQSPIEMQGEKKPEFDGDDFGVLSSSDDPCDTSNTLKIALEVNDWWKLLDYSVRYLVEGDISEETLVIEAVYSSLDICAQHFVHLYPKFKKLLQVYEGRPYFKDTRHQLIKILTTLYSLQQPITAKASSISKYASVVYIVILTTLIVLSFLYNLLLN